MGRGEFGKKHQKKVDGWGGRIRTRECMDQNHVSYRLTTPHPVPLNRGV